MISSRREKSADNQTFDWFSGGWHGRGTFKVTFNSGGAIEFAENFKRAVARGEWRLMTIYANHL